MLRCPSLIFDTLYFMFCTSSKGPPSFTVTQLTGQRLSTSSVTLRISPLVGSRYVVFYREDGQQFTRNTTLFSSANNVVINGLQSNTGYTMRVQASNDYGSTNSSDVDVYTLPEGMGICTYMYTQIMDWFIILFPSIILVPSTIPNSTRSFNSHIAF